MDYMRDLLQELSSTLDTDSSSGEESAGEEDKEDKKEDIVDEDDQAEQAKLPQYASRFKVGVCCVRQVCAFSFFFNKYKLNLHQFFLHQAKPVVCDKQCFLS